MMATAQRKPFISAPVIILFLCVFGFLLYANTSTVGFYLDDAKEIRMNPDVQAIPSITAFVGKYRLRSLAYFSFFLNFKLNGFHPEGYHLVNILFHGLTASALFVLLLLTARTPVGKRYDTGRWRWIAFAAALLFLAHPIQTAAVTYIMQRLAVLATFFYVLTVCCYIYARVRYYETKKIVFAAYGGAMLSLCAGLLSKEIVITVPLMVFAYEWVFFNSVQPRQWPQRIRIMVLLLGGGWLIAVFSWFNVFELIQPERTISATNVNSVQYALTQLHVIVRYLQLLIAPIGQSIDHDVPLVSSLFNAATLGCAVLLGSLIAVAGIARRRFPLLAFGILWFFIALLIESSIIPLSDVMVEHRLYLPSVGFVIALAYGLSCLGKRVRWGAFVMLVGVYVFLTFSRNALWHDEFALWSDAIRKAPLKPRGYLARAHLFEVQGDKNAAVRDYEKALALNPLYTACHYNYALFLAHEKKYDKALAHFTAALSMPYTTVGKEFIYVDRGLLYECMGQYKKAYDDYMKALDINNHFYPAFFNLGIFFEQQGMLKESVAALTYAIRYAPHLADAYYERARVYCREGEYNKARNDVHMLERLGVTVPDELRTAVEEG